MFIKLLYLRFHPDGWKYILKFSLPFDTRMNSSLYRRVDTDQKMILPEGSSFSRRSSLSYHSFSDSTLSKPEDLLNEENSSKLPVIDSIISGLKFGEYFQPGDDVYHIISSWDRPPMDP